MYHFNNQMQFLATAFISCSLRNEDKPFIDFIEQILMDHQIKPFGTVGRYAAAPQNPATSMHENIPLADMIVVVATPRYNQQDIQSGTASNAIPEMLHVESGIAFANNKPIIAFVQKGTSIGSFLPNVTQYITLDGSAENYADNQPLIYDLLNNAYISSLLAKQKKESAGAVNFFTAGLAIWGGVKILEAMSDGQKPKRRKR